MKQSSLRNAIRCRAEIHKAKIDALLSARDAFVKHLNHQIAEAREKDFAEIHAMRADCPHTEVIESCWVPGRDDDYMYRVCTSCGLLEEKWSSKLYEFNKLARRKPVRKKVHPDEVMQLAI